MIWGGICWLGGTRLKLIERTMDARMYHGILIQAVQQGKQLLGNGFHFQENNEPKHSAKINFDYLRRKEKDGIRLFPLPSRFRSKYIFLTVGTLIRVVWPPQSPDLNPIEVWMHLKMKLSRDEKSSKEAMWRNGQKAWKAMPVKELRRYISTMRARCRAVLLAKGYHTKY